MSLGSGSKKAPHRSVMLPFASMRNSRSMRAAHVARIAAGEVGSRRISKTVGNILHSIDRTARISPRPQSPLAGSPRSLMNSLRHEGGVSMIGGGRSRSDAPPHCETGHPGDPSGPLGGCPSRWEKPERSEPPPRVGIIVGRVPVPGSLSSSSSSSLSLSSLSSHMSGKSQNGSSEPPRGE